MATHEQKLAEVDEIFNGTDLSFYEAWELQQRIQEKTGGLGGGDIHNAYEERERIFDRAMRAEPQIYYNPTPLDRQLKQIFDRLGVVMEVPDRPEDKDSLAKLFESAREVLDPKSLFAHPNLTPSDSKIFGLDSGKIYEIPLTTSSSIEDGYPGSGRSYLKYNSLVAFYNATTQEVALAVTVEQQEVITASKQPIGEKSLFLDAGMRISDSGISGSGTYQGKPIEFGAKGSEEERKIAQGAIFETRKVVAPLKYATTRR